MDHVAPIGFYWLGGLVLPALVMAWRRLDGCVDQLAALCGGQLSGG